MLSMSTFGELAFHRDDEPLQVKLGRSTGELFVYLVLNNDLTHRREKLAEVVWPGKPARQSRSALNTAVWRINAELKRNRIDGLFALEAFSDAAMRLMISEDVRIDCIALPAVVTESEAQVRDTRDLPLQLWQQLQTLLQRYRGPFLEGCDADWILRERERLYSFYARGTTLLMNTLARHGRYEEALECGREILKWDDLRETIQRKVMWLYVMNGQRREAIAQYERFRERLKDEIGVRPMAETVSLYRFIIGEEQVQATGPQPAASASDLMSFMAQCDTSRSTLFAALGQFEE